MLHEAVPYEATPHEACTFYMREATSYIEPVCSPCTWHVLLKAILTLESDKNAWQYDITVSSIITVTKCLQLRMK